jgi:hypothetical protein
MTDPRPHPDDPAFSPGSGPNLTEEIPRPESGEPARGRIAESLLLALAGGGLLAGAWAASVHHLRVFSSPYPLWILLALNGVFALGTGVVAVFVPDSGPFILDGPDVIRVPRDEWEALQRRLRPVGQRSQRPAGVALVPFEHKLDPGLSAPSVAPSVEFIPAQSIPVQNIPAQAVPVQAIPVQPIPALLPPTYPSPTELSAAPRREQALAELQSIAEGALFASENLRSEELKGLVDDSSADLARIARTLDVGVLDGEGPSQLLIRLLRLHTAMQAPPSGGRFAVASVGQLATRLNVQGSRLGLGPSPKSSSSRLRPASDDFDAIAREMAPAVDGPRREGPKIKKGSAHPPAASSTP